MPLRDDLSSRPCDRFMRDLVLPNQADVFIYTDTSDFYYNGVQYYPATRRVEILNNNSFRLHDKIDFIETEKARGIIEAQIRTIVGGNLKSLVVESPYDPAIDPKFKQLHDANVAGSSPNLLIHQWRKLKLAYALMLDFERSTNSTYETTMKWRFDMHSPGSPLVIKSYNYGNTDVYIAGGETPIVYDWYAFGKRRGVEVFMNLYDRLGSMLHEGRVYMAECSRCHIRSHWGAKDDRPCRVCKKTDTLGYCEITLAPEYHLFRLFRDAGIRVSPSGYAASPYRYKDHNDSRSVDDIMRSIGNATLVNYTPTNDVGVKEYKSK